MNDLTGKNLHIVFQQWSPDFIIESAAMLKDPRKEGVI